MPGAKLPRVGQAGLWHLSSAEAGRRAVSSTISPGMIAAAVLERDSEQMKKVCGRNSGLTAVLGGSSTTKTSSSSTTRIEYR